MFLEMSDKVGQWESGAHERRGRGNDGLRGNKAALGVRDQTSTTHKRKVEAPAIEPEDELERFLVVSQYIPLYKPPVSIDWIEPALCRFFADFTTDTDNLKVNAGFLYNLSLLYNEAISEDELFVRQSRRAHLPISAIGAGQITSSSKREVHMASL